MSAAPFDDPDDELFRQPEPKPVRSRVLQPLSPRPANEPPPNFDDLGEAIPSPGPNGSSHGRLNGSESEQTGQNPRFPRVWLDDAEISLTNDDYLKHIIGRQSNILIYGPSGDGKTFFTGDLLAHIATGQDWRGKRVRECLVVYVAAEAGTSILRRLVAWRDRNLSDARTKRTPFVILTRGANILDMHEFELIMQEFKLISIQAQLPVGIVCFDTLSRSTPGGDENTSMDMGRVVWAADQIRAELKATTVFVHHSGKDVAKGARGHTSLFAAADTVISVVERVATLEKSRDGISGEQFPFELEIVNLGEDEDGDLVTTCLVRDLDAVPHKKVDRVLSGVARVALQALTEAVGEIGQVLPQTSAVPAGAKAVTLEQWRARFAVRYGTDGEKGPEAIRKAFTRGREALLKVSAIGICDPYCWVF